MSASPFQPLHAALQAQVDCGFLPGVSTALLRGREVVDTFVCGWADVPSTVEFMLAYQGLERSRPRRHRMGQSPA